MLQGWGEATAEGATTSAVSFRKLVTVIGK